MAKLQSMSIRIPIAVARKQFASIVQKTTDGERIKLTRYNKTVAVIIPKRDLEKLRDCEDEHEEKAAPKSSVPKSAASKSK
jgi:prevent-host-death family protein